MTTPDDRKKDDWLKPKDHARNTHQYRARSRMENGVNRLLRDWFGNARADLEIESHQGEPQKMGDLVDNIMSDWNVDDRKALRNLVDQWPEIIGAEFSKYTLPSQLEGRTLYIEVFNTVILMKLNNVQAQLLARIKEFAGDEVAAIRFTPGGRSSMRPR